MEIYASMLFLIFLLHFAIAVPQCFAQAKYPRPLLYPAGLNDCIFMAELLLKGDKAHAPMHWGHHEEAGWKLPALWNVWGKSCFITMDMLPEYEDDEVVFALDAVAKVAVDIINYCQTSPRMPKLGGREVVGPEGKTIVVLAGKVPETGPKPSSPELRILPGRYNASDDTS